MNEWLAGRRVIDRLGGRMCEWRNEWMEEWMGEEVGGE